MPRYNCTLSVAGYGERNVRCSALSHGMEIRTTEGNSRSRQTLYTHKRAASGFTVTIICASYREKVEITRWIRDYFYRNPLPEMRVMVPVRNFVRTGIPMSGTEFGDEVGAFTYLMTLNFEGTDDTVAKSRLSEYVKAPGGDPESVYFHPAGVQLSGAQSPPDYLYSPPESKAATAPSKAPYSWGRRNWW